MTGPELIRANIENLIALWTACGVEEDPLGGGSVLHVSKSWPWRLWFDYDHQPDRRDLEQLVNRAETVAGPVTLPQWPAADELTGEILGAAGFEVGMKQEAMVASLATVAARPDGGPELRWVTDLPSAGLWTRIASESFGYTVDERVIAGLVGASGAHLLLADDDGATVGTGLLLQTGRIAGVHMVGVPPSRRRRGYAREITFGLLALARELGCEHATLQASAAGELLYRQLGFEAQGTIRSYKRKEPVPDRRSTGARHARLETS